MNEAFALLEAKVEKAASALRRLTEENGSLTRTVAALEGRLKEAQKVADASEKRKSAGAEEAKRVEALQKDVKRLEGELGDLRSERTEVRERVSRLVSLLGEFEV